MKGFIVGMSRSGTQWLTQRLDEHSQVTAVGELSFYGRRYIVPTDGPRYTAGELASVRKRQLSGGDTTPASLLLRGPKGAAARALDRLLATGERYTPGEALEAIAQELLAETGKPWLVEKTPHHVNFLDRITADFPDARFVITARDPYGFMLSYKHQGDRKEEKARRGFQSIYHPVGASIVWRGYARSIERALAQYPDRTMLISTEEIADDPARVLERTQAFLGLDPEPLVAVRSNSSFPSGDRPELQPADLFWMNRIAGDSMQRLGIPPRPPEAGLGDVAGSLASLPGWSMRTAKKFYRSRGADAVGYLRRWLR